MGLDLKLLPMTFLRDNDAFSHTVLPVRRCTALFDELMDLPSLQVPAEFSTYLSDDKEDDELTGNTQKTPYDEPLTYVRAHDLLRFKDHEGVRDFGNRGIWAYLEHLPPDSKVALYWD